MRKHDYKNGAVKYLEYSINKGRRLWLHLWILIWINTKIHWEQPKKIFNVIQVIYHIQIQYIDVSIMNLESAFRNGRYKTLLIQ